MGTKLRLMANYNPYVYLTIQKKITKTNLLFLSSTLAYGGYGKFNWGVDFSFTSTNHLYLTIGSQNLPGFFLPKSTYGSGLYIMIAKQL
jgi:hypothetical protein